MKTLSLKDVFTHIFTVALSAVAQICKQFKCPSVDGGIKKVWYVYTHSLENYSAIIKEVNPAICNKWMDLEGIVLSETSQVEKDKCQMISFICGILKQKSNSGTETVQRLPELGALRSE